MKPHLIVITLGALLLTPTVSRAQSYDEVHKFAPLELEGCNWPTYKKSGGGDKAGVMALQYLLRNRGFYKSKVDGVFGTATEAAVRNFQRAKGLTADGVVGPRTWPVLVLYLKKGDRGDAVRALQILLRRFRDHDGRTPLIGQEVDGIFGASTKKNLRFYQENTSAANLVVDGISGAHTWAVLL